MKFKAFSLIELLIVMAIVGILAAIAIPAYKSYTLRVKISSAQTFSGALISKAIQYYDKNGEFPNASQLGLPTQPGSPTTTEMETNANNYIAPYVAAFGSEQAVAVGSCNIATMGTTISNLDGVASDADTYGIVVVLNYTLIDVNGVVNQICGTYAIDYSNMSGTQPEYTIPNCYNMLTDYPAYEAAMNAITVNCN